VTADTPRGKLKVMTRLDAYAAVLKLTAISLKIARLELRRPPPPELPALKAETHAARAALGLAFEKEALLSWM